LRHLPNHGSDFVNSAIESAQHALGQLGALILAPTMDCRPTNNDRMRRTTRTKNDNKKYG